MAHAAGLHIATDVNWMPIIGLEYAEKFAKAVLANTDPSSFMSYQEGYEAGRLAERERCAQIAKKWIHAYPHPSAAIEEEIRAGGTS
jgi:hypothetical protein